MEKACVASLFFMLDQFQGHFSSGDLIGSLPQNETSVRPLKKSVILQLVHLKGENARSVDCILYREVWECVCMLLSLALMIEFNEISHAQKDVLKKGSF